ncbi:MAG: LapA family protein [Actinobacteria bacterium]|nr:LapA family protein [Actinomycetota bacterium]
MDTPEREFEREPEREFERNWQPRLWFTLGLLILIAAYLIAFVVGNDEEASVNFVFAEATTSLIWVILLSLLAGLVGGVLLSQLHRRRQRYRSEASLETPSSIDAGDS